MGKATRWLKGLFGIKTSTNNHDKTIHNDLKRDWRKSYYDESEKEQSKHAIAVAAATAMAADAAVAAAQAAVAVVRLTGQGRGNVYSSRGGGGKWAAVKIQTAFRGYLASKALRALKGLVKIQALVRGYLVRRQATATLHGMQALIRAQATVRSQRAQVRIPTHDFYGLPQPEIKARRSMDIFDDTRSEHASSVHSRRLSTSFERRSIKPITEDIPKIVEVDPGRPKTPSRPNNKNNNGPRYLSDPCDHTPSYPPHLSIPTHEHYHDAEWGLTGEECLFSTAHSTPRFMNSGGSNPGLVTPCKSLCGDGRYDYSSRSRPHYGNYQNGPNYMANTQSFRSKIRSHSAPKQRPQGGQSRKRLSLNEMMESRNSLRGVRMERSCSQVQGQISFENAVIGKLDRSCDLSKDPQVYQLQRNLNS